MCVMTQEHMEEIEQAVKGECPQIYANAFAAALGIGDVLLTFQKNGHPAAVLNLSFTVAKTLSVKLGLLVAELEKDSGQKIMTTDEVVKALNDNAAKKTKGKQNDHSLSN
jgi:hypothetical protein